MTVDKKWMAKVLEKN